MQGPVLGTLDTKTKVDNPYPQGAYVLLGEKGAI